VRRFSVMIPVHSPRECLKKALDSLIPAGFNPALDEVVIVNSSGQPIDKSWLRPNGIGWVFDFQVQDLGMADNWNQCWKSAHGRYVHILHDDDYPLPHFYTAVYSGFTQGALCAATGYKVIEADGQVSFQNCVNTVTGFWNAYRLTAGNPLVPSCVVFDRAAYDLIGGYRKDIGFSDWDFYLRCRHLTWFVDGRILSVRFNHPEQDSQQRSQLQYYQDALLTIDANDNPPGVMVGARHQYGHAALAIAAIRKDKELQQLGYKILGRGL
jgi:hypothetical protein